MATPLDSDDVKQAGTYDLAESLPDETRIPVAIGGVLKETTLGNLRRQLAVVAENQAPKVVMTVSTQGVELGQSVALMADATDSDGQVVRVEFLDFSDKIGEATTARANFAATPTTIGTHVYSAKAYDNTGASAQSDPVAVVVRAAGQVKPGPPTNVVASVVNSAIVVNATPPAAAGTSPVAGYQVFVNGQGYPSFTNVALPFTVPNAVAGTAYFYQLEASSAAGDSAKSTQSNAVTIPVTPPTPVAYNTTLDSTTTIADGMSFTPASTEQLKFDLISGTSGASIDLAITSLGATSYVTLASEYAGQGYAFVNSAGTRFEGVFPASDNLNIQY